jgi:hypothetical protein
MGVLLVVCPETGREFSTGIQLDEITFRMLTAALSIAYCPYCHVEHRWTPREARLVEAIPPRDWVESFQPTDPNPTDK